MRFEILLISLVFLAACGSGDSAAPTKATPNKTSGQSTPNAVETPAETETRLLGHFKFESTVDATAKTVIQSDLKRLANWADTTRPDEFKALAALTGLTTINAQSLSTWLSERVTYFSPATGGNFEVAVVKSAKKKIIPLQVPGAPKDGVVAANMGPQIYEAYRINIDKGADGILLKFDGNYVDFLGLRTGVVQLGASTFSAADTGTDAEGESLRLANSIFRLSALFHEARHSDGNTKSGTMGLLHAACPGDGTVPKEYAGALACDSNSNGPYTLGAKLMDVIAGICDNKKCSNKDRTTLQAISLDYLARVLVKKDVDTAAEANLTRIDTSAFETVPAGS